MKGSLFELVKFLNWIWESICKCKKFQPYIWPISTGTLSKLEICAFQRYIIISIVFYILFQKGPETIYQPAHWLRAKMFLTLGPILTKSHHQIKSKILLNFEKSLKKKSKYKAKSEKISSLSSYYSLYVLPTWGLFHSNAN